MIMQLDSSTVPGFNGRTKNITTCTHTVFTVLEPTVRTNVGNPFV
uniref:Uncharacterized protein n=1 Tax=Aegilops tauschii subsp. strangulata TaxID=200361 RepID=A0A453IRI3_AEGTS